MIQGLCGLIVFIGVAWLFSENKKAFPVRTIAGGLILQFAIALTILKVPVFKDFFLSLNTLVYALEDATRAGTSFVFGFLGGGPLPFEEPYPGAAWVFGFRALPLILVMSALSALLYYWRIIPMLVQGFAFVVQKVMGISGALGLSVAANIFVGMLEAPLIIRPYLNKLSRSELFTLMNCGMATIAGTMLVLYAGILKTAIPESLGHILIASVISVPASILIAQVMVPESEKQDTTLVHPPQTAESSMDAISRGTTEGISLIMNVAATLIVFVALVALVNSILGLLPAINGTPVTLQYILGHIMSPVAWLCGISWEESHIAGQLLGTKVILNEFIAYLDLAKLPAEALTERSRIIITYAMCGFANLGSLGILVGGLGAMMPERRKEILSFGGRSIIGGVLSTCMTGAIVGILY
ncbi:MAG: NupC/NupG family nucleoside CNT transporter [Desulfovibrio sp.]